MLVHASINLDHLDLEKKRVCKYDYFREEENYVNLL